MSKVKLSEVDLSLLSELAKSVGRALPRTKFITAPEINELALQSVFLRTKDEPLVKWILTEGFFLHTNKTLHGIDDMIRGIFMSLVVQHASLAEESKEEGKGGA